MSQDDFDKQKKQPAILFNYTAATAAGALKDYPGSIESYKAVLALTPDDAVTSYRIGQAYRQMSRRSTWTRSGISPRPSSAKGANQQQATQVKTYLRKLIVNYQQASCDNLIDAELNELLQLAGSSADRPSTYNLPSPQDLDAARKDMTIASVITDLKAGGDKAKVTWLAVVRTGVPRCSRQADRSHAGYGCGATQGCICDQRRRIRCEDHAGHGREGCRSAGCR